MPTDQTISNGLTSKLFQGSMFWILENTVPIGVSIFFTTTLLLSFSSTANAQTLDQAVTGLLLSNCAGLNNRPNTQFGPQLTAICGIPTTGGVGAASGGGAGSVQSSAVSIHNSSIFQRLKEARGGDEDESGSTSQSNLIPTYTFSPLASLELFNQPFSASSPGSAPGSAAALSGSHQWGGLSLFGSGRVEALNRDQTTFQDGYDSTIYGFTVGTDYRFSQKFVAGLAFSYSHQEGDFDLGGNFDTRSFGPIIFASFNPHPEFFAQIVGSYTRNNYDIGRNVSAFIQGQNTPADDRRVAGSALSSSDGNVLSANILVGHDHPIGNFTIGPRLGLNYSNTHIQDYSESGATGIELVYDDQHINSFQSVVGLQGSMAISTEFGVLIPQVNADYIHEFANSQRFINVKFVQDLRSNPTMFRFQNEQPVRNFANLGIGLVAVLQNGLQPFVNFRAMVGNRHFDNYAGTFGIRKEF